MSSIADSRQERDYWRTLDELANTPECREIMKREFPEGADSPPQDFSRRRFLQLMGASIAMTGLSGCKWPKETIVPYANRPEGMVPGVPEEFASTFELGGVANGILVKSYDGRPVKIEGNPLHPASLGATGLFAQASLLDLYDPDRSRSLVRRTAGQEVLPDWDEFRSFIRTRTADLWEEGGEGLAILTEASSSPSLADMRSRFTRTYPNAGWYEYEPLSGDNARDGARIAYGTPHRVIPDYDKADVVAAIDDDFLGSGPTALKNARDFFGRRDPDNGEMNRLFVVENGITGTGSVADHRTPLRQSDIWQFTLALAAALRTNGIAIPEGIRPDGGHYPQDLVKALAADLAHHKGRSIVTTGPRQPAALHALVHLINNALGNNGKTIRLVQDVDRDRESHGDSISALATDMGAGRVSTLVILGGNPAYDAPADLDFKAKLEKVGETIHLSLHRNETSRICSWHLPRAHYLESWGDARSWDGTWSTAQPLIAPLYGGKSAIEVLALVIGEEPADGHSIVRRTLADSFGNSLDFEKKWRKAIHDGVVGGSEFPSIQADLITPAVVAAVSRKVVDSHDGLDLVFCADSTVYDGRYANNGWLQETPDHLTKLTWDNAALIAPATAEELGVTTEDLVKLKHQGKEIELPVYVMPGQPKGSIGVWLGYGRTAAGHVGDGVGSNTYTLRTSDHLWVAAADISKMGGRYKLATTQSHYLIDDIGRKGRADRLSSLVREATLAEYEHDPRHAVHKQHIPPLTQLFKELSYDGHAWGMSIDLAKCNGCNACVVACQSENNISVVGKDEVRRGREMAWLRIDRYFSGDANEPEVLNQPVTCQQCENAPCEQVCPVGATQHSTEGLNDMTYNRCIGTRYCSNNCPYKVRRFNFFNNQKHLSETEKMVYNPDVTPRARGVMEKCTFCVQRIQAVKIVKKNNKQAIQDGDITSACAQACPSRAIEFGDLTDKGSRVAKSHANVRSYYMLEELNVRPRNAFLARIKNPNSALGTESTNGHSHS